MDKTDTAKFVLDKPSFLLYKQWPNVVPSLFVVFNMGAIAEREGLRPPAAAESSLQKQLPRVYFAHNPSMSPRDSQNKAAR